jgi:hypothetical protein
MLGGRHVGTGCIDTREPKWHGGDQRRRWRDGGELCDRLGGFER